MGRCSIYVNSHRVPSEMYSSKKRLFFNIPTVYTPLFFKSKENKKNKTTLLLKKIPMLSGFLNSFNGMANASLTFIQMRNSYTSISRFLKPFFHWFGLGIAIFDFFRIPLVYLNAIVTKSKQRFTLSKTARWIYSTLILTLSILSFVLPVIASPIFLIMASMSVAVNIFLLIRHVKKRIEIIKALHVLVNALKAKDAELEQIIKVILLTEEKMKEVNYLNQHDETLHKEAMNQFYLTYEKGQSLYNYYYLLHNKLLRMGAISYIDKSAAIIFSSIVLLSLFLGLMIPMGGVILLMVGTFGAGLYILSRVMAPLIVLIGKCFKPLFHRGLQTNPQVTDNRNEFESGNNEQSSNFCLKNVASKNLVDELFQKKNSLACSTKKRSRTFLDGNLSTSSLSETLEEVKVLSH